MSAGEFVPPSPEELDALLPDCTVEVLIAQGGMGAIYRGIQTKLDRPVAIKVLPVSFGEDLEYASRFEQEAKAMAKLSHNNIVGVYDYGETSDGTMLYFIMEFVEGSDLFTLLHENAITYTAALPLLIQICDALHYAHTNGIVHRDIKPANILIDKANTVKMADFGLAKVQRGGGDDPDGAKSETAFGTPDYIAPEALVAGVEVDHRADIYSLGVVIYEVLTGRIPQGTFDLPSTVNAGIDRRFDDIIIKSMAHDRDERYADVEKVKKILVAIEKTPRLVAGSAGGAAPAVPVATGNTAPVAVAVGAGAAAGRRRTLQPEQSSNTGAIVTLVLFLLLAGGGAFYWFALKPGIGARKQIAEKRTLSPGKADKGDNAATALLPPAKIEMPPSPEPDPEPEPDEPEIVEPVPKPIVAIPFAGRLHAFGSMLERDQIDISKADGIDDIVTVRARDGNWHTLRLNGETVSSTDAEDGLNGIRWIDARKRAFRAVRNDGTLWQTKTKQLFPGIITNALQAAGAGGGGGHNEALLADGTLAVWGGMYGSDADTLGEPPQAFTGLVDLASAPNVVAVLDKEGAVYTYNNKSESSTRKPRNDGDRVVDVEAAGGDFVALTKSGRAFSWPGIRFGDAHYLPPHIESEYFIKVRGGNAVKAAQKADGTWAAWGNRKWGIIDKIESLPPTPDIAMAVYGPFGHLFWIEPNPAHMPEDERITTAPGPGLPFFSETIDTSETATAVDPSTLSAADRLLAELRQRVDKRYDDMVEKPYSEGLIRLNDLYLSALERNASGPDAAAINKQLDQARKAIDGAGPNAPVLVPAGSDTSAIPATLAPVRATYRSEHSKLAKQRDTYGRAVLNTYLADLQILESEVTGSMGEAEAAKVREAREAAAAAGLTLFGD